jgi:hypothetical protein
MFINKKLTPEQELHSKVKNLKGKTTRDKFSNLFSEVLDLLAKIKKLDKFSNKTIQKDIQDVLNQYNSKKETTSDDNALHSMIYCFEDLLVLFEDMKYDFESVSYNKRLEDALTFIRDFSSVRYVPSMSFYDETSNKVQNQLKLVIKEIRHEVARQDSNIKKKSNQNLHLEDINIGLIKEISELSSKSFRYSELASRINSNHQEIELNKVQINLAYKNMDSLRMLVNLLDVLSFHDKYLDYLKEDGYIRKLIKKLYKNPDGIDVITNSLDIIESLKKIKAEINEINDIINPINKVVFSSDEDTFKDELVKLYKDILGGKN